MARYQSTTIFHAAQWTGEVTAEMLALLGDQKYLIRPNDPRGTILMVAEEEDADPDDPDDWMDVMPSEWVIQVGDTALDGYFDSVSNEAFAHCYAPVREPLDIQLQVPTTISPGPVDGVCTVTLHPARASYANLVADYLPKVLHMVGERELDMLGAALHTARERVRNTPPPTVTPPEN